MDEISDRAGLLAAFFMIVLVLLFVVEGAIITLSPMGNFVFAIVAIITGMATFVILGAVIPRPILGLTGIASIIFVFIIEIKLVPLLIIVMIAAYLLRPVLEWMARTTKGSAFIEKLSSLTKRIDLRIEHLLFRS